MIEKLSLIFLLLIISCYCFHHYSFSCWEEYLYVLVRNWVQISNEKIQLPLNYPTFYSMHRCTVLYPWNWSSSLHSQYLSMQFYEPEFIVPTQFINTFFPLYAFSKCNLLFILSAFVILHFVTLTDKHWGSSRPCPTTQDPLHWVFCQEPYQCWPILLWAGENNSKVPGSRATSIKTNCQKG